MSMTCDELARELAALVTDGYGGARVRFVIYDRDGSGAVMGIRCLRTVKSAGAFATDEVRLIEGDLNTVELP